MKRIIALLTCILFITLLMAQTEVLSNAPYEKEWRHIDSLLLQQLPESAKTAVLTLETDAKAAGEANHVLKAKLYAAELQAQLEENGEWTALQALSAELAASSGAQRALLASILGQAYLNYAQQNQWQIANRTRTMDAPGAEESSWTLSDFYRKATELYLASLSEESTQAVQWADFSPLVNPGLDEARQLRPTLYDLLLHRALDYFRDNDALVGDPAYQNTLTELELLGPVAQFVRYQWPAAAPNSRITQLLRLLQEGLDWRLTQNNEAALLDLDLIRLRYVHDYLQNPDKDAAYRNALESLVADTKGKSVQAMPLLALAQWHFRQGQNYQPDQPGEEDLRWQLVASMRLLERLTRDFPKSFEAREATALISQIKHPSLSIQLEDVHLPQEASLVSIQYQNVEQVHFRLLKLTEEEYLFGQDREDWLPKLVKKASMRRWSVRLPDAGDYRIHRTETSFQGLDRGIYCLLVSTGADFPAEQSHTVSAPFWVSELGLLYQQDYRNGSEYMAVNRRTGRPVAGATLEIWTKSGRQNQRKESIATYETDELGQVTKIDDNRQRIFTGISTPTDRLYSLEGYYLRTRTRSPEAYQPRIQFFLDRAIYRPGQTLYFNGLLTQGKEGAYPTIDPQQPVTVVLYDANNQQVSELKLTTNSWGTVHGEFTLPAGGLLGNMQLRSDYGSISFRVEAYKRPRFQVELDELAQAAQLGDTVTITGQAQAYAGPAVANAQVTYTVTRRTFYPWFYWRYPARSEAVTLASGELNSDEQGQFQFTFPALADAQSQGAPHYQFQIQVDVTDEAGETRSASKSLQLAEFPVLLSLVLPDQQDRAEPLKLKLDSKNYDEQPVSCDVQLHIFRLSTPTMVPVDRYWPLPDTLIISEAAFKRDFPYFTYGTAQSVAEVDKTVVWQAAPTVDGTYAQSIDVSDWPVGQYLVELATVTPAGDTLRQRKEVTINDWASGAFGTQLPLHTLTPKTEYQPGESLQFKLGTAAQNVGVYSERLTQNGDLQRAWFIPQNSTEVSYPLTEAERGTLTYDLRYFYQNRVWQKELRFRIPWTNKRLQIRTEVFRHKLRPGNPESWLLRVLDPNEEGTEAEVLASMYDASLDQFVNHEWQFNPEPGLSSWRYWRMTGFEDTQYSPWMNYEGYYNDQSRQYPSLRELQLMNRRSFPVVAYSMAMEDDGAVARNRAAPPPPMNKTDTIISAAGVAADETSAPTTENGDPAESVPPPLRTNLQETAFFFPELYAAADGSLELAFTSPEALTSWKLQLLAHDKELAYALHTEEVVTQKELMILPNFPRFLRTGDEIRLAAKVSNLSEQSLLATATVEFFDLATEKALNSWLLSPADYAVELSPEGSAAAYWQLSVPADFSGSLGYRVYVRSETFSDGEEGFWPVLSNQVLVTESQPIFVAGGNKASFALERLAKSPTDRQHHQLSFDMVANPVWEAIKALPYLQEYPYDCTEQLMNRWFANSLALHIASEEPQLEAYYESWAKDSTALQSPLAQNDGNKTALLTETPWVTDALAESEQRRQIRKLFDRPTREAEQQADWQKIVQRQSSDGSFSWFPGGPGNTYITQYVVEQFARLRQLTNSPQLNADFVARALSYLDQQMAKRYRDLAKRKELDGNHFGPTVAQYLYVRSHFPDIQLALDQQTYDYWFQQAVDHWTQQPLQTQTYAAIALQRQKRTDIAANIFQSLRERSRYQEALGRYWPGNGGWYWYEHPLETHCLLMEAYRELGGTTKEQDELRLWLLRNKETNRWETTKATAAAIHALLQDGSSWQQDDKPLVISFPKSKAATAAVAKAQATAEAGTGYFQIQWPAAEIKPALARVEVRNPNTVPAWGGLYWQYFSPIEDIEVADNTPLQIERKLYVRTDTGGGEELRPVEGPVEIGDKVTVRLVVRTDRDMEFVHLKDLRAAGLEPTQVLSGYRYQGGLGYYQSTTDLATHFFFDYLPKGEYVLEYDLRVFHAGDFSGGMASLQCMYAPKFAGHSAGERLRGEVKE